jgi:hypothetical protein
MASKEFTINTSEGEYDISASVRPEVTSATASVFAYVGHKEDELAKAAAEILAATLKTNVVVAAGIHWDNLTPEAIQRIIKNSEILVEMILEKLQTN